MAIPGSDPASITLPFERFWSWLKDHRNCILRAGTPYAVLMDHDDYHWDILQEDPNTEILQLVRGKELIGEIVVISSDIAYVHSVPGDNQESIFECVVETPEAREAVYYFVLAHSYDEEQPQGRRWTH